SASDAWRPPTGAGHASEKHHTARKCTLSSAWRSPTGAGHASENTAPRVNTAHRTHGVLLQELAMPTKTSHRAYMHPIERMALSYRSWPCQRKHHTARTCT